MPRTALALLVFLGGTHAATPTQEARGKILHRAVDLSLGESQDVELTNGRKVTVKLLDLEEMREDLCSAVWRARVKVAVAGAETWITAGTYHLPVTLGDVQVDCAVTKGVYQNTQSDFWSLVKDARLRLWPAGSPLMPPGALVYPVKQRWFAGDTWMANEPILECGMRPKGKTYYHSGLDLGGSEGVVDVVSATDGLVARVYKEALPEHEDRAVNPGYPKLRLTNEVFVVDDRGWYHVYYHMKTVDVRLGQKVRQGEKLGVIGKVGGSGGWEHLHYEIFAPQASGRLGTENAYPFLWEAYVRQYAPPLIAVAGPLHHQLAPAGAKVELDGRQSRAFAGQIARFEWFLSDGSTVSGPTTSRTYERPGTYSEALKVTDTAGRVEYDFALSYVVDKSAPLQPPPRVNANYAPSFGIRPGDPVTFRARTFNTREGEETWDFGDGSPAVTTKSANDYAETVHRYAGPGQYVVRIERTSRAGVKGMTHLQVRVEGETASAPKAAVETLQVASFSCDATPPIGHPIIGSKTGLKVVDEPLLLKGIVLQGQDSRLVIAALDWCTMGTPVYHAFRRAIAEAAETPESRVSVHCTHTHSAPFQDDVEPAFIAELAKRAAAAVRESVKRLRSFTRIGVGKAKVVDFASNRRVPGPGGKIRVRWAATKDAALRAEPEGKIDPWLRTVSLFEGEKPIVRLHYYASHPQSFYGDGRAHPDVPGWARARLEKEEGIPHLYFTGCAGDITAGKYNDGSPDARAGLLDRLTAGMKAAIADTRLEKATAVSWKTTDVNFTPRAKEGLQAWPPIQLSRLRVGSVDLVHLPGEPFIEYQLYAQSLRPDRFVCVAGYGDGGPGYICTDDAEGGYEPSASRVGAPSEKALRSAIEELLK